MNNPLRPKILVVLGPTSSGKSNLAVKLAKKFKGEIISADSRQVYRGMDLGTGKITKKEMRNIPHHLLDIANPKTAFSVSKYKKLADKKVTEILKRKKLPIICGGTGFYIDAVVNDIILPEVKPNAKLRKGLEKKNAEVLFELLQKIDPERAATIDRYNKVRLVRALEIAEELGNVPKVISGQRYDPLYIGLDLADLSLQEHIARRLKRRLEAGMASEVKQLKKQGVSYRRLESFGLEYKNCALFLQNQINKEQLVENIKKETWQYVKRQRTWFKRNDKIKWFNPLDKKSFDSIKKITTTFLKNEK